jgi:hypothetical protein
MRDDEEIGDSESTGLALDCGASQSSSLHRHAQGKTEVRMPHTLSRTLTLHEMQEMSNKLQRGTKAKQSCHSAATSPEQRSQRSQRTCEGTLPLVAPLPPIPSVPKLRLITARRTQATGYTQLSSPVEHAKRSRLHSNRAKSFQIDSESDSQDPLQSPSFIATTTPNSARQPSKCFDNSPSSNSNPSPALKLSRPAMATKPSTFAPREAQPSGFPCGQMPKTMMPLLVSPRQVKAKRSLLLEDEKSGLKVRPCPGEKHANLTPTVATSSSGKHKFFK